MRLRDAIKAADEYLSASDYSESHLYDDTLEVLLAVARKWQEARKMLREANPPSVIGSDEEACTWTDRRNALLRRKP